MGAMTVIGILSLLCALLYFSRKQSALIGRSQALFGVVALLCVLAVIARLYFPFAIFLLIASYFGYRHLQSIDARRIDSDSPKRQA